MQHIDAVILHIVKYFNCEVLVKILTIQQKILNIVEWQLSQCFRSQSSVMGLHVHFLPLLSTSASTTFIYQVVRFLC